MLAQQAYQWQHGLNQQGGHVACVPAAACVCDSHLLEEQQHGW